MKKFLALSALVASIGFSALSTEAKTGDTNSSAVSANAASGQIRIQLGGRNRNRRVRTVTRTRIVRSGGRTYRETYQTTYRPNGRVVTRVINRVRIR